MWVLHLAYAWVPVHLGLRAAASLALVPASLATRGQGLEVVVKSERDRGLFEAGLAGFLQEARMLAQFDHPALVKVYRFWEANGTAFMVMPFIEGKTLKDTLKEMPAPPSEAWLMAMLAFAGIAVTLFVVPSPGELRVQAEAETVPALIGSVLRNGGAALAQARADFVVIKRALADA